MINVKDNTLSGILVYSIDEVIIYSHKVCGYYNFVSFTNLLL